MLTRFPLSYAKKLGQKGFLHHAAVLTSGTAISQILLVASAPLLSRLYAPDAFGLLGVYISIVSWLNAIGGLRYEQAIVLAKDNEEASNLFAMTCTIISSIALLSAGAIWLVGPRIASLFGTPELASLLWLLPLSVLSLGYYNAFNYWFTRVKQFTSLATAKVVRSVGTIAAQTGAGAMNLAGAGLILGQIAGQLIGLTNLAYQLVKHRQLTTEKLSLRRMPKLASEHKAFPLYQAPQAILGAISVTMPTLVFGALFGPAVAGWYWFTQRFLRLPSELIGQSVRQVFFQRASELQRSGKRVYPLFKKATLSLLLIALIPALLLIAIGPQLFSFVFGTEWQQAGIYARWIALWWLFEFINPPSIKMFTVLGMQRHLLTYELGLFVARAAAIASGAVLGSALVAIALFALVGMASNLAIITYMWATLKRHTSSAAQRQS